MDIAEIKGTPILGVDVGTCVLPFKYQNRRADYLSHSGMWWNKEFPEVQG